MIISSLRTVLSTVSFASLFFIVAASATPEWNVTAVKESVHPPPGWVKYAFASPDHVLRLRIALPQPRFHVLEQHLMEISDPNHERYGKYLSKDQVDDLVRPCDESLDLVTQWLENWGIYEKDISLSAAKDWVTIAIPLRLAEQMLNTVRDAYRFPRRRFADISRRRIMFGHTFRKMCSSFARLNTVFLPSYTRTLI